MFSLTEFKWQPQQAPLGLGTNWNLVGSGPRGFRESGLRVLSQGLTNNNDMSDDTWGRRMGH